MKGASSLEGIVIPNFQMRSGMHCLFSGLNHILMRELPHTAEETDESDLYLQTSGMNVEYNGDLNRVWLASQEAIIQRFAECYGLSARAFYEVGADSQGILEQLVAGLRAGRPVLLFIRTSSLIYHEVFREGEERNHIILLYGLDEQKQEAYIADTSFLDAAGVTQTYRGIVPLELILRGIWGYAWFERDKVRHPLPEAERFQSALDQVHMFLQGKVLPGGRYQGLLAYRIYVSEYTKLMELGDALFTSTCKNVYYCYRVGGMLHQLDYLCCFIERHDHRLQQTDELLNSLDEMKTEWKKTLFQLYKIGISVQRDKIKAIQERSNLLLDKHELLLQRLLLAKHAI
jgi:hypothetical protein